MHVISFRILREYTENHADSQEALRELHKKKCPMLFLLEESGKTKADLQYFLDSESLIDDILNGTQKITLELAEKLGDFFHIEASLFHE
ncbi:hypothetical protein ACSQ6I_24055 [Anabaena sp. WFMT]|uniref:hypothetical protein n=1 Tax=Anabaena sp. WFMT TaxID=3449730 RepID=UPI003F22B147